RQPERERATAAAPQPKAEGVAARTSARMGARKIKGPASGEPEATDSDSEKLKCKTCVIARKDSNIVQGPRYTRPWLPVKRRPGFQARKEVIRCLMVQQGGRKRPARSIIGNRILSPIKAS